jgi:hypothetical protein
MHPTISREFGHDDETDQRESVEDGGAIPVSVCPPHRSFLLLRLSMLCRRYRTPSWHDLLMLAGEGCDEVPPVEALPSRVPPV